LQVVDKFFNYQIDYLLKLWLVVLQTPEARGVRFQKKVGHHWTLNLS